MFMIASFSKCTDKTYSNRNLGGDIWLNGPVHYSKLACQEKNRKDFGNWSLRSFKQYLGTGTSPLTRFFGPGKNRVKGKPRYTGAPVGMWTWGHVHTKFWHVP